MPKRVDKNVAPERFGSSAAAVMSRSPISFDVPITLVGLTALSELVKTTRCDAVLHRRARDIVHADDVGLDRLERRALAQEHVLVGGGVEQHLDVSGLARDRGKIADIGE